MEAQRLVEGWRAGRARVAGGELRLVARQNAALAERFRQAYRWLSRQAIFSPYSDIHFGAPVAVSARAEVQLHEGQSYASFLLLPLLTLMCGRRLLLIGAPGRGKTTVATLMAMLAGASLAETRRATQHGHPQLTIHDLLGSPLPRDLVNAERPEDIQVAWRHWIGMPVKIIDEYNRIPTKTQSALLSLMSEGYAEMYGQIVSSGRSAWFLTANDDLGGGTFQVIDALKDRIDVVVRCTPLDTRRLGALAERIQLDRTPEAFIPSDLVFSTEDLQAIDREVRSLPVPADVLEAMAFFADQLDFCQRASRRLEFMNKDTLHLAGRRLGHVCNEDCPLDKQENLCTQTERGVSARTLQTLLHYARALAWFRGLDAVSIEDVRQLLPWVLHEKLDANAHSAFFQRSENQVLLIDRVSWIQQLFDRSLAQLAAWRSARPAPIEIPEHPTAPQREALRKRLRQQMKQLIDRGELNGAIYAELVSLKRQYIELQEA